MYEGHQAGTYFNPRDFISLLNNPTLIMRGVKVTGRTNTGMNTAKETLDMSFVAKT